MFGTIVNAAVIVVGAILGLLLRKGLSMDVRQLIMQANGLCVVVIGLKMAMKSDNDLIIVISLVLGGLIGHACHLDERLERLGINLKKMVRIQDSDFVDGFVSASLIFCIGAMAIVGALEAALNHNYEILFVKASLDGLISIVLASTMGVGVAFASLAVLVYQGALTALATVLQPVLTDGVILYMSAAGGVLIMAIGLSVAGIKEFPTINLLPGIFIAGFIGFFF